MHKHAHLADGLLVYFLSLKVLTQLTTDLFHRRPLHIQVSSHYCFIIYHDCHPSYQLLYYIIIFVH